MALDGDPLLMFFIVEIRTVAADNDQERNLVVHRCPETAHGKEQITVRLNVDAELVGTFVRQCGAQ